MVTLLSIISVIGFFVCVMSLCSRSLKNLELKKPVTSGTGWYFLGAAMFVILSLTLALV